MQQHQQPLQFEFSADKTFADYYPGANKENIAHLSNCVRGNGEQQLFIYGDRGLGKSHLLQACCHLAQQLNLSSFYLPLNTQPLPDPTILDGLEQINLVSIDDINCVAGNQTWEQALFNLYNKLHDQGHRLIVADSFAPSALAIALPDLKTRLAWGLVLSIPCPSETDKIATLSFKAQRLGFELSPQVGHFLITRYTRDLPSLWRLLKKLDHASLAAQRKLTIPFLKEIL